jgi:hypothetical protein
MGNGGLPGPVTAESQPHLASHNPSGTQSKLNSHPAITSGPQKSPLHLAWSQGQAQVVVDVVALARLEPR